MIRLAFLLRVATVGALILGGNSAWAQTATHIYELNGSFADSLGGPSLTGNGATPGATGLTFGPGQGPSLSNGPSGIGINATNYSIEMYFSITDTGSYRKLIDFKNLTTDNGVYNLNTSLNFYNLTTGPASAITANTMTHLIVTRNSADNAFVGYINGQQQIAFTDSSALATFTGVNNIAQFMRDDTAVSGEQSGGFLDFIRIYDTPLTQAQVTTRYNAVVTVPEASPLLLLGIALPLVGVVARRRIAK